MFELRQVRLVILVPGRYKGLPCTLETEDPSNCLSSIWTPKTWPFYSLCFPCFSPVPISFCSASNSLHPSELREGWCVFNFLNTTQKQKFMCLPQKEISLSLFSFYFYWCHLRLSLSHIQCSWECQQSLSECLTVQQVVHVYIFEMGW